MTTASSARLTPGLRADGGGIGISCTRLQRLEIVLPDEQLLPDSSSCITTPSEKTSERASAVLPSSSSGATYDIFPLTMPASVRLPAHGLDGARDAEVEDLHGARSRPP